MSLASFDAIPNAQESSLRRLWPWFAPHRRRLALAFLAAMVSAGAGMMVPVVIGRVIVDHILLSGGNGPDFGQRALADALAARLGLPPLAAACLLAAAWIALTAFTSFLFLAHFARVSHFALAGLRADLFAHVEKLPPAFFDRASIGKILTRITNDVEALSELFLGLGALAGVVIPFLAAALVMLSLDALLTLELTPVLPLAALASYIFRKTIGSIHATTRAHLSRLGEYLHENLAGIEVVQACGREALNLSRYSTIAGEVRRSESRAVRRETSYYPFIENLSYLALALILWLGGGHVLNGWTSIGAIVLFVQFSDMLFRPVVAFGDQAANMLRARAASARIFHLLDWRETLRAPEAPAVLPDNLHGKIEFRDLSFGYVDDREVLHRVSLTINPGESLAIVGPTGSGKTTLTRLICRFYDAPDGALFIDDVDIMRVAPAQIRRRVGVIFQDFHIFAGSIFDNIALGDANITREKAIEAARAVDALDFIEAMPQGFDSQLGDRGHNLSQGQRQLLAFARALARDPEILILDEATASIDPQTEAVIEKALAKIKRGRTTIIIAHRLRTIREASRIVALDQGRIVETGTHDELLVSGGLYKALHDLQGFGEESGVANDR